METIKITNDLFNFNRNLVFNNKINKLQVLYIFHINTKLNKYYPRIFSITFNSKLQNQHTNESVKTFTIQIV